MTTLNFQTGQIVSYSVCSSVYKGTIVKITKHSLIVIDDEAGMELWNAGYSVGSEISLSQVIN
jgi:hypothetical protein